MDLARESVLCHLRLRALHLRLAHGHVDRRHPRRRGKRAQRVDEDGNAVERQKLFGLRVGLRARHPRAQSRSRKNGKDLHNSWSIAPRQLSAFCRLCVHHLVCRVESKALIDRPSGLRTMQRDHADSAPVRFSH